MKKVLAQGILYLTVCAATAWGQANTSLRGTVTDPSGAAIPGAQVTIVNAGTGFTRSTTSGAGGVYIFVELLPGTYNVTVEAKGFEKFEESGVVLRVALPGTVDIQMKVGAMREVVSVTAAAPPLNTTDPSLGHTMGVSEIEDLPLQAESMPLLLSFQGGVVYNGENILTDSYDTRAGSVNGERSDQNNITLDGVSINDEFNGYAFTGVLPTTQFSVDEFRVTTSNYGASGGRSAGAQIAMVTKGGTNKFHGTLYDFNRSTIGEANDYFLKLSELASGEGNVPEHLVRNVFGGTLGGPIKKDRLFFFFNYQGEQQSVEESVVRNVPSATLREGIIQYECADPSQCPGGGGVQPGYYALGPTQLKQMDPLGIGPSQVALNFFNTYPEPNDYTVGNIVNFAGYRFAAPTKTSDNWYIARLDYKLSANGNHALFLRGAARDDHYTDVPFLPGTAPEDKSIDLSKGFVGGYTGVFGPHLVNNVHYGITHQSIGTPGDSDQPWVIMRGLDEPSVYSSGFTAPVHNLVDTLDWVKGSHSLQLGGNMLFIRRHSSSQANSFSDAITNSDWLVPAGFANLNDPLDPTYTCPANTSWPNCGYGPAISGSFTTAYDWPMAALMGIASEIDARYNYRVTNPTTATPLAQGAPVMRHWATDSYSLFAQDTWHVRPHLTVTYGLNYQLMTPITETTGQEVTPSVNIGAWFNQRAKNMMQGIPSSQDALISFSPSGSYYGKSGLYSAQKANFAPRVGVAWSPHASGGWLKRILGDDKTVVRAGFGMYYDNFGPALAMTYDASGSFGLSTLLENSLGASTIASDPRITGMNTIPTSTMPAAPPSTFPVTYPQGTYAIANGIDQSLQTPYSYAVDFSIQRQLPGQMTLDVAYVGHMGHRLLALDDVGAPTDLVDTKTGIDYFSAAKRLSQLGRANTPDSAINAGLIGNTAQYWQDMLAPQSSYTLCSNGASTNSLLVATYDDFGPGCNLYNETFALFLIDAYAFPTAPVTGLNSYYNTQYASLWDWRSIGYSNYNALQVGLHRQMTHGLLFGFNYTYSKSNDLESEAERGVQYLTDSIINPWSPHQEYGPSDFDLRHQINGYWVIQLPFGHGRRFGAKASKWADAFIGGWQWGGTTRWTSGFPESVFMGYVWPTNWDEMGWADTTGLPIATGTTSYNGVPNMFKNPAQASLGFTYAYPGESGNRNPIRGDGYYGTDMNLAKNWKIPHTESQTLQFRWSVFNVTNTNRFDAYSSQDEVDISNTFGDYSQTLTNPRVMEFALIYQF